MDLFTDHHTPAHIVKVYPRASDFFIENMIDYCCGGNQPLKDSFMKSDIDGEAFLAELNDAYEDWRQSQTEVTDWDNVPILELVDYIVDHHHAFLKDELPALSEFVTKIFRVHGTSEPHLKELQRLYNEFRIEMEEHTVKEEAEVFPLIKQYATDPSPQLLKQIKLANNELEDEHEAAGDILKKMRLLTNGFEPPIHACNSYRITYDRLSELEMKTFAHVHLENNVLFTRL